MSREAARAECLVKTYRSKKRTGLLRSERVEVEALRCASFSFEKGSLFGLLGPNGAGKTTTVKILSTVLLPDSGEAFVGGYSVLREPRRVKEILGVVFSADRGFYGRLTGLENLVYYGMLYGMSRGDARRRAEELLDLVDLGDSRHRLYEEYSLGMKARLAVAKALIHDPEVVILDEPTIGLDPISSRRIRSLLSDLARRGKGAMITTHNMWEAEAICDTVGIIVRGRVVALGRPEDLKSALSGRRVIEIEIPEERAGEIPRIDGCEVARDNGGIAILRFRVDEDPLRAVEKALGIVREAGLKALSVRIKEPSLEDLFVEVVRGDSKVWELYHKISGNHRG